MSLGRYRGVGLLAGLTVLAGLVPVLTQEQRAVLNHAHRLVGAGSLIPPQNKPRRISRS